MSPETEKIWDIVSRFVEILVIPFCIYVVRALTSVTEELRTLRTVLIGVDGKNGIRSRLVRVERKVEKLSLLQAARHGEKYIVEPELQEDEDD